MAGALVSLVMPIYNSKPEFLHASLSTLLGQTYDNLEVILVIDSRSDGDDSSIRHTLDAFKDDHRIRRIVRRGKRGYCSALNAGIRISSGEFIARLDSDDYCDPTRIEKQMDILLSQKAVLTGTWANVIDEQGQEIGEMRTPTSNQSIRNLIMLHNPFVHSSIVTMKRVMSDVGLYNEAFEGAEDYEFYLRVVARGYQCLNIPHFLTYLRQTRESITRGRGWMKTRERYFRAKCEAVVQLKYRRAFDVLYAMASPVTLLIPPSVGPHLKKTIGWYTP